MIQNWPIVAGSCTAVPIGSTEPAGVPIVSRPWKAQRTAVVLEHETDGQSAVASTADCGSTGTAWTLVSRPWGAQRTAVAQVLQSRTAPSWRPLPQPGCCLERVVVQQCGLRRRCCSDV